MGVGTGLGDEGRVGLIGEVTGVRLRQTAIWLHAVWSRNVAGCE